MSRLTPLRLELLRQDRTQVWLAEATGIHAAEISRIVNGLHANDDKRARIADALDVPIDALWPPPDTAPAAEAA